MLDDFEREIKSHEELFGKPIDASERRLMLSAPWPRNVLAGMLAPRQRPSLLGTLTRSRTSLLGRPSDLDSRSLRSVPSRRRSISPLSDASFRLDSKSLHERPLTVYAPKTYDNYSVKSLDLSKAMRPIMAFDVDFDDVESPPSSLRDKSLEPMMGPKEKSSYSSVSNINKSGSTMIKISNEPVKNNSGNTVSNRLTADSEKFTSVIVINDIDNGSSEIESTYFGANDANGSVITSSNSKDPVVRLNPRTSNKSVGGSEV
jgi:hypothetical protein